MNQTDLLRAMLDDDHRIAASFNPTKDDWLHFESFIPRGVAPKDDKPGELHYPFGDTPFHSRMRVYALAQAMLIDGPAEDDHEHNYLLHSISEDGLVVRRTIVNLITTMSNEWDDVGLMPEEMVDAVIAHAFASGEPTNILLQFAGMREFKALVSKLQEMKDETSVHSAAARMRRVLPSGRSYSWPETYMPSEEVWDEIVDFCMNASPDLFSHALLYAKRKALAGRLSDVFKEHKHIRDMHPGVLQAIRYDNDKNLISFLNLNEKINEVLRVLLRVLVNLENASKNLIEKSTRLKDIIDSKDAQAKRKPPPLMPYTVNFGLGGGSLSMKEAEKLRLSFLPKSPKDYDPAWRNDPPQWGPMTVVRTELVHRLPTRMRAPTSVHSESGVVPASMHRWAAGRSIFKRKVRKPGASILFDLSGSMGITESELYDLMFRLPGSLIAGYSGSSVTFNPEIKLHESEAIEFDYSNPEWFREQQRLGVLRVLAEKGQMVDKKNFNKGPLISYQDTRTFRYGECNMVDGPALAWLGKQEGPRIWVSDSFVTEVWDDVTNRAFSECVDLTTKYGIFTIDGINGLENFIQNNPRLF